MVISFRVIQMRSFVADVLHVASGKELGVGLTVVVSATVTPLGGYEGVVDKVIQPNKGADGRVKVKLNYTAKSVALRAGDLILIGEKGYAIRVGSHMF